MPKRTFMWTPSTTAPFTTICTTLSVTRLSCACDEWVERAIQTQSDRNKQAQTERRTLVLPKWTWNGEQRIAPSSCCTATMSIAPEAVPWWKSKTFVT